MKKEIAIRKDYKLKITHSEFCENPNERDGEDFHIMITNHRQCYIKSYRYSFKEILDFVNSNPNTYYEKHKIYYIKAYIHSGVSLSIVHDRTKDVSDFDTCIIGFLLVNSDFTNEKELDEYAETIVTEWNDYLMGKTLDFELIVLHPYHKVYLEDRPIDDTIYYDEEVIDTASYYPLVGTYNYEDVLDCFDIPDNDSLYKEAIEELKDLTL